MSQDIPEELVGYRAEIDALDAELVDVLARRFEVVRNVGVLKAKEGLSVVQPDRAQAVKERAAQMAADKGLDPDFMFKFYELMIGYAHDLEDDILEQCNSKGEL